MGGISKELLPRDAELARRAAGGDGAAFVRLYDRYSAEVFEAALVATESVERAADATQRAFLRLLRRPPAIDAPDRDVFDRLRGMALYAGREGAPQIKRTPDGAHAPASAGVGWLRSETVANGGARFDDDWSAHLTIQTPPARTASEVALGWQQRTGQVAPRRRRLALPAISLPTISLPRIAVPTALALRRRRVVAPGLALAVPAVAAVVVSAGTGGDPQDRALEAASAPALVALGSDGPQTTGRHDAKRHRAAPRPSRSTTSPVNPTPSAPTASSTGSRRVELAAYRAPAPATRGASLREPTARQQRPARIGVPKRSGGARTPTAVPVTPPTAPPAPQSPPAQPTPAQPAPADPAPSQPAPTTAPTEPQSPNSGGAKRNCNSKRSTNPC